MSETGIIGTAKARTSRRSYDPVGPTVRARTTNDPLSFFTGNSPEARRCRDLFRFGCAEVGGRLGPREQMLVLNWVRLQAALEAGDTALAPEVRHAWKAIQA